MPVAMALSVNQKSYGINRFLYILTFMQLALEDSCTVMQCLYWLLSEVLIRLFVRAPHKYSHKAIFLFLKESYFEGESHGYSPPPAAVKYSGKLDRESLCFVVSVFWEDLAC